MQSSEVNEGFAQLMTQHHREIYLYIWRLTRGASETEDLFQDTFLRAYKGYSKLPEDANMRAWLFKIATNLCRNHFRQQRRRQEVELHAVLTTVELVLSHPNGSGHSDPEQLMLAQDTARRVLAIIDDLPMKQKAALIQRKLHGLPYDSIAATLQCSAEAARAHVFQALKKMRTALESPPRGSSKPHRAGDDRHVRDTV
jgi:RNA polymerase sigma-70 factor (ECF subfamily)